MFHSSIILYNYQKTCLFFFIFNLLRCCLVKSSRRKNTVVFYICLSLNHMVIITVSCFALGKEKKCIQPQSIPEIQDVTACNGGVPKVAMGNSSWLCDTCSCILQRMTVCLSTWHCVTCSVLSACSMKDYIAVLGAADLHVQLIFLLYSDPQ